MDAKQLKDSILNKALRGQLVKQNFCDNSSINFIEETIKKKKEMIVNKVIKKDNEILPIKEIDIPFEIPSNWNWVRLGNLYSVTSSKRVKQSSWTDNGVPFYRAREIVSIKKGENLKDPIFISQDLYNENILLSGKPKIGDILVTGVGTLGVTYIVENETDFYFKDGNVVWLKNLNEVNSKYIEMLFESSFLKQQIIAQSKGTTVGTLTIVKTKNLLIPFPPLEEQKEILNKVHTLLEKVKIYANSYNELILLNNELPRKLEMSILQYAMQGKLVQQETQDQPVRTLINVINVEKQQLIKEKVIKKEKELKSICGDEIPFEIPATWECIRLKDIAIINPKNSADESLEAGFIPMKLIDDGFNNNHSFEIKAWGEIKKGFTHFQNNDIVIAKITPCFENRKSTIIRGLPNNIGAGTTELYVVRPITDLISREYLLWIFKSYDFISKGVATYSGTAGQQRVSKTFIENYPIPLPPYQEQLRIVNQLKKMNDLVNNLK